MGNVNFIFMALIALTNLLGCSTVKKNDQVNNLKKMYSYTSSSSCMYLELRNDNTFYYQENLGLSIRDTEGIYINHDDEIILYSTTFGRKYFDSLIANCEKIIYPIHNEHILFEKEVIRKKAKALVFKEKTLNIIKSKVSCF